ncbi:MAG: hypothetical protein OXN90_09555 [Gemmatimonadota bacterium]|nr:hypothetical protein [Gemmatimonadota bacterium]
MKAIVLLLALASAAFADEYTPVDWLEVTENAGIGFHFTDDGGFKVTVGAFSAVPRGSGCVVVGRFTIDNKTYSIRTTKWQMRRGEDSAWSDVSGTEGTSEFCSLTPNVPPGEYRLVAEVEVEGVVEKYASRNTLVVAGDPETAVEAVTWGSLKLRATR